ncbi:MAG: type VI secretion system baseplate subunit TssE [Comamonadaceae bacterium]|nr:MAG: type VI secretion system baseplate subunit TssE [Comamonadaceae bacterium]
MTHPGTHVPLRAGIKTTRANAQLMPSLFDRLRNDSPGEPGESPSAYTVTPAQLRDLIRRDLALLLNTTNAESLIDRETFPEAAASTVNFGVQSLAGAYLSQRKWTDIERSIRQAIADFEPRLLPSSIEVIPLAAQSGEINRHILPFEIRALIALTPYPLQLTVQSAIDFETSRMRMTVP